MKGIACSKCGRAQVFSDDWVSSVCAKLGVPPAEDSIEAILPKLKCKDCGTSQPLLVWMDVIPTGPQASSGRVCVDCDQFLSVARVEAAPDAIRCVPCQDAFEKAPPGTVLPAKPAPSTAPAHVLSAADAALFEALRSWRLDEAHQADIPAYCILYDKHLLSIVAERPQTLLALQSISGFGPHKLNRYGSDIIDIVRRLSASA